MPPGRKLPALNRLPDEKESVFVLLETNRLDAENHRSYLFTDPVDQIEIRSAEDLHSAFTRIENYAHTHYLAGFVSYELGYLWEEFLPKPEPSNAPLLWFGVFEHRLEIDHRLRNSGLSRFSENKEAAFSVSHLHLDIPFAAYQNRLERIKRHIEAGDTYQVNFTGRYRFEFSGSPYAFYEALKRRQEVAYNAFIKRGETSIISLSPELFFRRDGQQITMKPMKGTLHRGRTVAEDCTNMQKLASDEKNRSENLMIVDLLRNDLGRISQTGSVRVEELFSVERFNTLLQMTSTIRSEVRAGVSYLELFRSLFPCGSVTGAPKLRTMEIIHELEEGPRGIYTGAIGFIAPGEQAVFNVAIRTLVLQNGTGEMGVGSGIVDDSQAAAEFAECRLKANFLVEELPEFSLIESIRWNGTFHFLSTHLLRLRESADYFGFTFEQAFILEQLRQAVGKLHAGRNYKLRLLLHKNGDVEIESREIRQSPNPRGRITIAETPMNSRDVFLFHKTTNRSLYDRAHRQAAADGFSDVIFLNEKGEITEGAISNLFIRKGGRYFTPPVECGLLNGIYRREFLRSETAAGEKVLHIEDLFQADEVFLTNAVRGKTTVELSRTCIQREE